MWCTKMAAVLLFTSKLDEFSIKKTVELCGALKWLQFLNQ